jgi:hypothetical protein
MDMGLFLDDQSFLRTLNGTRHYWTRGIHSIILGEIAWLGLVGIGMSN